jgi:hypothetical protein
MIPISLNLRKLQATVTLLLQTFLHLMAYGWQVFYSTNMPILESRFQIYAIIQQSFNLVDSKAPAKKDAVLV